MKKLIAGNWKMNNGLSQTQSLISDLKKQNQFSLLKRNASFQQVKKLKQLSYYKKPLHGYLIFMFYIYYLWWII